MPSTIASDEELRALTGVLGEAGRGVFMAATGSRLTPQVMESIAAANGRPAYISTVLMMYNEAEPQSALPHYDFCAQAIARGNEVYILTSCQPLSIDFNLVDPYLMLGHSAFEKIQGVARENLPAVYADPSFRKRFREDLSQPRKGVLFLGNWERIEVTTTALPLHAQFEGMTVAAMAGLRGSDPLDAFFDLAIAEGLATCFVGKLFQNVDAGVAPLLKHPASVVTLSDAGAHLIYLCDAGFGLHFLAHWVRETNEFTLAEGIRRLTSDPARRFRIPDRGRLVPGAPADMLLFDPAQVGISKPRSVSDLPGGGSRKVRDSCGVHAVWVNGTKVHDGRSYVEMDRGPGHVLDRFDS